MFPSFFLFIIFRVILRDWCKSTRLKYIFATNAFSWKRSKGLSDSLRKAFSTWTTTNLAIQTNFGNCNRIYLNKKVSRCWIFSCSFYSHKQVSVKFTLYVLACVSSFCKCQVKITNIWYVINEWLGRALTKSKGGFLIELHWQGLSLLILLGLRKLDSIFNRNKHCGLKSGFFH